MFLRATGSWLAIGALLLSTGSPGYAAAAQSKISIHPLVALSALASSESQRALCSSLAASTASAAAMAQGGAQPGCVLPVVDAPPPPVVSEAPPPAALPPAAEAAGIGALPLLLGLAGVVGLVVLLARGDDDGTIRVQLPESPG
jgi:hypothetical protein